MSVYILLPRFAPCFFLVGADRSRSRFVGYFRNLPDISLGESIRWSNGAFLCMNMLLVDTKTRSHLCTAVVRESAKCDGKPAISRRTCDDDVLCVFCSKSTNYYGWRSEVIEAFHTMEGALIPACRKLPLPNIYLYFVLPITEEQSTNSVYSTITTRTPAQQF